VAGSYGENADERNALRGFIPEISVLKTPENINTASAFPGSSTIN